MSAVAASFARNANGGASRRGPSRRNTREVLRGAGVEGSDHRIFAAFGIRSPAAVAEGARLKLLFADSMVPAPYDLGAPFSLFRRDLGNKHRDQ